MLLNMQTTKNKSIDFSILMHCVISLTKLDFVAFKTTKMQTSQSIVSQPQNSEFRNNLENCHHVYSIGPDKDSLCT